MRYFGQISVLTGFAALALLLTAEPANARDPIKDLTGKRLDQHINNKIDSKRRKIETIANNPITGPIQNAVNNVLDACGSPAKHYGDTLSNQAEGRWKVLPSYLTNAIQPGYTNNLLQVRYAENIQTANGQAQTFGNNIYFPETINLMDYDDLKWMLHELQHTDQYLGNSQSAKLCDYMAQSVGVGFNHDAIRWEQEADQKADRMMLTALDAMLNNNSPPQNVQRGQQWAGQQTENLAPNELLIQNALNVQVVYRLQSETKDWTVFTIAPQSTIKLISDDESNDLFSIELRGGDPSNQSSVDGGSIVTIQSGWSGLTFTTS